MAELEWELVEHDEDEGVSTEEAVVEGGSLFRTTVLSGTEENPIQSVALAAMPDIDELGAAIARGVLGILEEQEGEGGDEGDDDD